MLLSDFPGAAAVHVAVCTCSVEPSWGSLSLDSQAGGSQGLWSTGQDEMRLLFSLELTFGFSPL